MFGLFNITKYITSILQLIINSAMKYLIKTFILFTGSLLFSCNGFVKTGVPQSSTNIEVSMSKEVFICQYIPNDKLVEIGNDKYRIDETWIEYRWSYINAEEIEIKKDFRNFYIRAFNLQTKKYDFEFSPEDSFFSKMEVLKPLALKNNSFGYNGGKLDIMLNKEDSIPEEIKIRFKGSEGVKTIIFTKTQ